MVIKNLLVSLLLVAGLSSCGEKDGGGGTGPVSDADGTWSSVCADFSVPGVSTASSKSSYVLSGGIAIKTLGFYSDAACATPTSLYVSTSGFTTGGAVTTPVGAKEFTSKMTSMTITLNTDEDVAEANNPGEQKICGGGFVKGQPKTLTAADCPNDTKGFNEQYNIYKIDGTKLYVGDCGDDGSATDCSAPTKRPTTLPEAHFTKA